MFKRICSKKDTLDQTVGFDAECVQNEPSEHAVEQHVPGETFTSESSPAVNENSQSFAEDVTKNSFPEKLRQHPEDISEHNQVNSIGSIQSEQRPQLGCDVVPDVIEETSKLESSHVLNQTFELVPEDRNKNYGSEHLQPPPEYVRTNIQTSKSSFPQQTTPEQGLQISSGSRGIQLSEGKHNLCSELIQTNPVETETAVSRCKATIQQALHPIGVNPSIETSRPFLEGMKDIEHFKVLPKHSAKHYYKCTGGRKPKAIKKKYMLRSLVASDRVLRTRSNDKLKAAETGNNVADVKSDGDRKRRKKKKGKRKVADEYSRIRTHLRYLLNRINYEQSLITAYSTEGWKGLSLEKLKPEKELQRATAEIHRRKLKIRDLFQHLDSLCAEGRLPESLFDSEGQIDSEDIFCAKCRSKDFSADNDIVLCDGTCDRGFHQYCLEPPLLNEHIPPDDEGWLCPGCDCKADCIGLVNDSQGTMLSITDSWEKVFPEAGNSQSHIVGLPSDDSDDNNYNPDSPETGEKGQEDESCSDESYFTSDEMLVPPNEDQYLGLPSDDSEDNDFYPDAPNDDEMDKQDSSSSDFTSDAEDLDTILKDNSSLQGDEALMPISPSSSQRSKLDGKEDSLNSELLSILESASGKDGSACVSGKRSIESLDYKKLYDETYGNIPSSSSDDEDYITPRKRKKSKGSVASTSANGSASVSMSGLISDGTSQSNEKHDCTPRITTCKKSNFKDKKISSLEFHGGSSSGKSAGSSAYGRLGAAVKQRLYKSFKENQYPDRSTKEALAKELEITVKQVSKWFENARWSVRHSYSNGKIMAKDVSKMHAAVPQTKEEPLQPNRDRAQNEESSRADTTAKGSCSDNGKLISQKRRRRKSKTPDSRNKTKKG